MDFFVKHKTISAFLAYSLFCVISLSIQSTPLTTTIEGVGSGIMMPFQKMYDGIQGGVGRLWAGFTELTEVREELAKTREKLQKYEALSEDLYEIKKENERLKRVLGLMDEAPPDSIPAIIISKDPDNWFRTIIINKGKSSGIKVNMPVIAFRGGQKAVVGKIIEARGSISRILPLISPNMKMGVKIQESAYPGILMGYSASSNICIMDYVSRDAQIRTGDIVVTSGQAGIFPQGIIVGTVIRANLLETSSYQRVVVNPIIEYNQLEEVYVIKREPDPELTELLEEQ